MKPRVSCIHLLLLVSVLLIRAAGLEAAVRVEEDEVVFTLVAPGAQRVFLVGDFNNWNPTLERMDKIGDTFHVLLFLLPGSYHYKYVVDGTWITDPDNPAADPKRGSPLVLEERAGTLTMGDTPVAGGNAGLTIKPSARYRGVFNLDDSKTSDDQAFDFYFSYEDEKVRSLADFKTISNSWRLSPLKTEINLDRGFVELKMGKTTVTGFDNDTIWTSNDPYGLIGDVGIYDYNAGYERKGFVLESRLPIKTDFRVFYADKTGPDGQRPVVAMGDFGNFPVSAGTDTTVYRFGDSFADEDTWAMEFVTDMGSLRLGWVARSNRGFHPGLLVEAVKNGGAFDLKLSNTREYWDADVLWSRWRFARHLAVTVAWGASDSHIRKVARSLATVATLGPVSIGPGTEPLDEDIPLLSSKRWLGALEYREGSLRVAAAYLYNRFEFDSFVNSGATAEINIVDVNGSYSRGSWRVDGGLAYTDQDYGATPSDFHYRTPTRNFWLDHRDRLDVQDLPAFDLERTTALGVSFKWKQTRPPVRFRIQPVIPLALGFGVDVTTAGFFEGIEYIAPRFSGERGISKHVYLQVDARFARYDKPSWNLDETFFSSYWEVGYRRDRLEASVGWGFDPVVLDPVINDYKDNGREELLRGTLSGRPDRSKPLGDQVRFQEALLEDFQTRLKLEVILLF